MTTTKYFSLLFGVFCVVVLVLSSNARAQGNYFWTGTGGGSNWNTPANWNVTTQTGSTSTVSPGNTATDTATINQGSGSASPVTLDNLATTTITALNLGSLASSTAYLSITGTGTVLNTVPGGGYNIGNGVGSTVGINIANGGVLAINPNAGQIVFGSGSNSIVSVTIGSGTLRNDGTGASITRLGSGVGAVGTMTVNTGGVIILPGQFIVGNAAGSSGVLNVSGGLVSTGTSITFGNAGANALLSLTSGTISSAGNSSFNANSTANITGGLYTLTSGFALSTTGTFNIDGGTVSVGTGFTANNGAVVTISSGSLVGTSGGTARLTAGGGSVLIEGGVVNVTGAVSSISSGGLVNQTAGLVTFAGFTVGNGSSGTYTMSGGELSTTALNVGSGVGGNGMAIVTGGTLTSAAGAAIGNGATVVDGSFGVTSAGAIRLNSGNGTGNVLQLGTNMAAGSAGTLLLQGGSVTPATGATNGFGVSLFTPATLTSSATASTIQGFGTLTLGSSGTKAFTNGGKVIASGANLVNNTGASPSDQTLDLTGSSFTVATTANRAAGSGWYAVNHGKLSMNVSGTTGSATTLNWGAPVSGSIDVNSLVNSARLTFNASTAASAITISLLASDRSDVAALFSQAGLPGGDVIGLWEIQNGSANIWTGLTIRYDDVFAGGNTPGLYFIPNSSGTWSAISATVDGTNFVISDNVSSLSSGYYALLVVPEPGVASLLLVGGAALLFGRRLRARNRTV